MIDLDAIKARAADSAKPIHSGGWEIEGRCPDERGVYWLVCTDCGMEWGENERGEHVAGVLECAHPLVADVRDLAAEVERLRSECDEALAERDLLRRAHPRPLSPDSLARMYAITQERGASIAIYAVDYGQHWTAGWQPPWTLQNRNPRAIYVSGCADPEAALIALARRVVEAGGS